MTATLEPLVDTFSRERFAQELGTNFCVIAPAGVGKTTAIVQRAVAFFLRRVQNPDAPGPKQLVVVTYTQKAANEMHARTREALRRSQAPQQAFALFERTFFGTIHSFCAHLIKTYGLSIGVTPNFEIAQDSDALLYQFLSVCENPLSQLEDSAQQAFRSLLPFDAWMPLLEKFSSFSKASDRALTVKALPFLNTALLDGVKATGRTQASIETGKKEAKAFIQAFNERVPALGYPEYLLGGAAFQEAWTQTFGELGEWANAVGFNALRSLSCVYRQFRIENHIFFYDDLIYLAHMLLQNPTLQTTIKNNAWSILLDEAQDTDKEQFELLLQAAEKDIDTALPAPGCFSMVGDPQQAIYSSRADLPTYVAIHKQLVESGAAETLTFQVTMRCSQAVVDFSNVLFPTVLSDEVGDAQVSYVPLAPRPWADKGLVAKIALQAPVEPCNTEEASDWEAKQLAAWILEKGLDGFGVNEWSEVALLTARKNWHAPLALALEAVGIGAQTHSQELLWGDSPIFAWTLAALWVTVHPEDSFEVSGMLRDIFNIADIHLANWVKEYKGESADGHPFSLLNELKTAAFPQDNPCAPALGMLQASRQKALGKNCFQALCAWEEGLGLKERFKKLKIDPAALELQWGQWSQEALEASSKGIGLAEWVTGLKKLFFEPKAQEQAVQEDCIQLYTCHKSKGLEWPVVIMPFTFRPILFSIDPFPRLYKLSNQMGGFCVSKSTVPADWDERLDLERRAELERLLYVSTTRARKALFWVDDSGFFREGKYSAGSLLRFGSKGRNSTLWEALPREFEPLENSPKREGISIPLFENGASSPLDALQFEQARAHSAPSHTRVLANSKKVFFPQNGAHQIIINPLSQEGSIQYGNWWHQLMEYMPWSAMREHWKLFTENYLRHCPDPERGRKEIDLWFQKGLPQELLKIDNWCIQTEIPFSMPLKTGVVSEGVIDFLAINSVNRVGLLIDWKTDVISTEEVEVFKETYKAVLQTYQEAVLSCFKLQTVNTYLYSTVLGESIAL